MLAQNEETYAESVISKMVQVEMVTEESFRKVKETLTRMGVPSKQSKTLYQSCHILHKKGLYYICHFKELYELDGRNSDISETDISRRNTIVDMLVQWNMIKVVNNFSITVPIKSSLVKTIKHSERDEWELSPKYAIGVRT